MRFEIGKYYKHSSGEVMRILACVDTTIYGRTLLAEEGDTFGFQPVGWDSDDYAENWKEIDEDEWLICSTEKPERNNYSDKVEVDETPTNELKIYRRGYHAGQIDLMRELTRWMKKNVEQI